MDLKFIGRGSAFNLSEGNNNAFYKNDKGQMFLIDCGESTFTKIMEKGLLNDVNELYVAITHTHSDHFGSFSSLALFMFFAKKQKVNLILTNNKMQDTLLKFLIESMGVDSNWINYITIDEFSNKMPEFKSLEFVETPHDETLKTFAIVFETDDGVVYYSADTNCTKLLEKYVNIDNLDKIYMDTCLADHENNVHVNYKYLLEIVPQEKRNKVYGMHIDNHQLFNILKENGFNVVEKI